MIRAAIEIASVERPEAPQSDHIRNRTLFTAMTSCDAFAAAAEDGLLTGSVNAVRLAFMHAEVAFEEAQQCIGDMAEEDVTVDVRQRVSALGLRLDALWMRLVCVYR